MTSTERRIRYSPEIPGPRIGESRSEWEIMTDLAEYVLPPEKQACLKYENADMLRKEIDEIIPLYRGIASLKKEGDSFQYGGEMLLRDGICPNLPDQKARFAPVVPQNHVPEKGEFYVTTRRGKQFNSMVYGSSDPLTGSRRRDDIFLSVQDAQMLDIRDGDRIRLRSICGSFEGVCRTGQLQRSTIQVFWPEANVLLPRLLDPASREPDYNTVVTVEKLT